MIINSLTKPPVSFKGVATTINEKNRSKDKHEKTTVDYDLKQLEKLKPLFNIDNGLICKITYQSPLQVFLTLINPKQTNNKIDFILDVDAKREKDNLTIGYPTENPDIRSFYTISLNKEDESNPNVKSFTTYFSEVVKDIQVYVNNVKEQGSNTAQDIMARTVQLLEKS